jgi:hypothetical protein
MPASGVSLGDVAAAFKPRATLAVVPAGADGAEQLSSTVIDTASTSARAAAALSVNISSRKESFTPKDKNHCEAGGLRDQLHPRDPDLFGLAWVSLEFGCPVIFHR